MCCWILQGRLLRKNDFEPVYSQTLFHTYVLRTPIAKNEVPSPPHICGEDVQCKKAAKMQCCKMQGCALQTTPSRRNTNKYLSRTDFSRNPEKISGEIQTRFLQKFEDKFVAPRSQLHVSPTTSALSTKCLFGINCLTLTLFSSDGGFLQF